jgi:D-arabinose 5-phosphate isomerase GutQ
MMLNVKGRVVVTGMGKSGHSGFQIAATSRHRRPCYVCASG